MNSSVKLEKLLAITIIVVAFIFIPIKIINLGYSPSDDANRHVAFSVTDSRWDNIILITPGLESDHNAGWHIFLKSVHQCFNLNKNELLAFSIIFLFLLFNLTGSLISPNCASWLVTILILFITQKAFFGRLLCGRPFLISCSATLIILKLWFDETWNIKSFSKTSICLISIFAITISVWLHGTWYNFLLLPIALLLSGKILKSLYLTILIIISTLAGAYLTGDFYGFIHFHYSATFNIFSENIFNWQLVSEFAEGKIYGLCLIPLLIIILLLIKTQKLKLNHLSKDPVFILMLLSWMLSLKVVRFWVDWGIIALAYWFTIKISELSTLMQSLKHKFTRYFLFLFLIASIVMLIPMAKWDERSERQAHFADFSKKELMPYKPESGGIIYNDLMLEFYYQYFENPNADYRYILGFEPAIMPSEDRKIFRDIVYSDFHFTAYAPWIEKLKPEDRIFACVDISKNYNNLDWIKASSKLWIGKLK